MRRTGKVLVSPTTGREACGAAGMTYEVELMGVSGFWSGKGGETLRGCADRRQTGPAGIAVLQAEEGGIAPVAAQQFVVLAALDDLAALDHQNGVGMGDGVQAVRDHDGGAVLAEMLDRLLHLLLRLGVERSSRFIQQDDRRVA